MDDLARRMSAVTANPPPTHIDVAALIAGEQRRGRRLRLAAATAGAAVVVTATMGTVILLPGSGAERPGGTAMSPCAPPSPSSTAMPVPSMAGGPPSPAPPEQGSWPTEPGAAAVGRLSIAIDEALTALVPEADVVAEPWCDRPQFQYLPDHRQYDLSVELTDGARRNFLSVIIGVTTTDAVKACPEGAVNTEYTSCEVRRLPDGGTAVLQKATGLGPADGTRYDATVYRADGTSVHIMTNNTWFDDGAGSSPGELTLPELFLTLDQIVQLGQYPDLTLYPR